MKPRHRAREPKTVRWLPVGPVDIRSTEFQRKILSEFGNWLCEIGFVSVDETATFVPAA